jgi:methylmalonyl-CoA/ethylmalonyl-CoA epimerase
MGNSPFRTLGINHIGIAAKDSARFKWFLHEVMGLPHQGEEDVASQKTLTNMYACTNSVTISPVSTRLETLEDSAGGAGPIGAFLAKKGGGIHHLAFQVDNIEAAIAHVKGHGVQMIDEIPRDGAHHCRIAFIHPSSIGGVLIELTQQMK